MNKCLLASVIVGTGLSGFGQTVEGYSNCTPVKATLECSSPNIGTLCWPAIPGRGYIIEQSPALRSAWNQVGTIISADNITASTFVPNNSSMGFYRVWQMTPSDSPTPLAGVNLVPNGDFEANLQSPAFWNQGGYGVNGRQFVFLAPGFNGSQRAARLIVSNYASGDAKWYFNDIAVKGGTSYRWSDIYYATAAQNVTLRFATTDGGFAYQGALLPPAANSWVVAQADFTAPSNATSMTVFHALTTNGVLTMDNVSVTRLFNTPSLAQGIISFAIDDGWREAAMNTSNILSAAGYHGTYFIITHRIGTNDAVHPENSVVNVPQIQGLYAAGHEIAGHTETHQDLTLETTAEDEQEIFTGRRELLSLHVGPVLDFAYPFGSYNASIERMVKLAGYELAATTSSGIIQKSLTWNPYEVDRLSVRSNTPLSEVTGAVDEALANKAWLVILVHHVDESQTLYSIPPSMFQSIVSYVKSKNAKVVTMSEAYKLMTD